MRPKREHVVIVRLHTTERAALEELADEWGLTLSDTVRRFIREKKGLGPVRRAATARSEEKELVSVG